MIAVADPTAIIAVARDDDYVVAEAAREVKLPIAWKVFAAVVVVVVVVVAASGHGRLTHS